jgi:hypothetical protein
MALDFMDSLAPIKRLVVPFAGVGQLPVPYDNRISLPAETEASPSLTAMVQPKDSPAYTATASLNNPQNVARQNTQRDLGELRRINDAGSGISQIKNPFGRTLARIGDVAERILAPQFERITPGTEGNRQRLLNQQQQRVNNDLGVESAQAKNAQEQALTDYTLARPDIEQSKIDQRQEAVRQKIGQLAAAHGQNVHWDSNGNPSFEDDLNSEAYQDRVHLAALHDANAEKAKVQADIAKNHYLPGTPEYAEAQRKLDQVEQRLKATMSSLGLRAQGLGLRREQMNANLYGVGPDGQPLPGAAQIMGDDGQTQTVGLRAANTAIKQQKGVGTFNDLVGSVDTTRKALEGLHNSGGSFADAQMIAAMNDPHSMVGKYVNGQLVKGNLNDKQIEALGAVNQLREQIGILRASTGGTAAEAQVQRMLDTLPTAGDSPAIVRNKLKQIDGVLQRLSPSVTGVHGGLSVGARSGATPKSYQQTATGPGGHKIGSNDGGNTWFDVQTGKAVQ